MQVEHYLIFAGVHSFVLDSKAYYKVTTGLWTDAKLSQFTRYELENYRQVSQFMNDIISREWDKCIAENTNTVRYRQNLILNVLIPNHWLTNLLQTISMHCAMAFVIDPVYSVQNVFVFKMVKIITALPYSYNKAYFCSQEISISLFLKYFKVIELSMTILFHSYMLFNSTFFLYRCLGTSYGRDL